MILSQKKLSADGFLVCVAACNENDFACAKSCQKEFFVYEPSEVVKFLGLQAKSQNFKEVRTFTAVANIQFAAFDQCLDACFPTVWPEVSRCHAPCASQL